MKAYIVTLVVVLFMSPLTHAQKVYQYTKIWGEQEAVYPCYLYGDISEALAEELIGVLSYNLNNREYIYSLTKDEDKYVVHTTAYLPKDGQQGLSGTSYTLKLIDGVWVVTGYGMWIS